MPCGNPKVIDEFFRLARVWHSLYGRAPASGGRHAPFCQRGENRFADAALGPVVFDGNQAAAGHLDLLGQRLAIDGLDAVEIDHAYRPSLPFQFIGSLQSLMQGDARADHGRAILRALAKNLEPGDGEYLVLRIEEGSLRTR